MVQMSPEKEPSILIGQLRLAVNVLTAGTCSDEGLEDATTLLLHLSRTEPLTRDSILELLLEGAQDSANRLQMEIRSLLNELKERNAKSGKQPENKVWSCRCRCFNSRSAVLFNVLSTILYSVIVDVYCVIIGIKTVCVCVLKKITNLN